MRNLGKSPWLFGIGIGITGVIAAVVGWGRLREVEVPRPLGWDHAPVIVCGDNPLLAEAVAAWRQRGHPLRAGTADCDVVVTYDSTLDERDSVEDGAFVHGRASLIHTPEGIIQHVGLALLPTAGLAAHAHELGHALGYQHPRAVPSGHVMDPSGPGTKDWRGLVVSDER